MFTFNFKEYYLNSREITKILQTLLQVYKTNKFVVNNFENRISLKNERLLVIRGNYRELLRTAVNAELFISFRNGLCDVVVASVKKLSMFIIYPDVLYPGKFGVHFSHVFGMKEIGYDNIIYECIFNKRKKLRLEILTRAIIRFIGKSLRGLK